ncbi:MAG: DegT/DnrJ/EryC1/StrS family aminotransferase [Thermoplasmatales archaeon]
MYHNAIHFVDLQRQYKSMSKELDNAVKEVMSSGRYVGGEVVRNFERKFSNYIGSKYGIGVGSGSDALIIALQALGIGPGDKVATVSFTFVSTVDAILHVGATPVFVDIDPKTLTINTEKLKASMSKDVKAIIPVHLYGSPASMKEVQEVASDYGSFVVEDAAQAHGASFDGKKVGSIGDIGCFSFYPSKNLGALGDGGFLTTNDSEIADRVKLLREYGQMEKYRHVLLGWNSRLDPIQASVLSAKLNHLDEWNSKRRKIASIYSDLLENIDGLSFQSTSSSGVGVYHIYSIFSEKRDKLRAYLSQRNIETGVHYPIPVHNQIYYSEYRKGSEERLKETETAAKKELSLPMFPEIEEGEVDFIVESVKDFFKLGS